MYVILGKKYFYEQILEKIDYIYRKKNCLNKNYLESLKQSFQISTEIN